MPFEIPTQPFRNMWTRPALGCLRQSATARPDSRRATAAEVLNILLDVDPPYAPIDTSRPAMAFAEAAPQGDLRTGTRHAR
jgi:hypothetical protein